MLDCRRAVDFVANANEGATAPGSHFLCTLVSAYFPRKFYFVVRSKHNIQSKIDSSMLMFMASMHPQ